MEDVRVFTEDQGLRNMFNFRSWPARHTATKTLSRVGLSKHSARIRTHLDYELYHQINF